MDAEPVYCWREDVKAGLDTVATSRYDTQIDRCIVAASRFIDKQMRRVFYPTIDTRRFDYLDHQYSLPWRLWLDSNELAAPPTQVLSSGIDITAGVLARNGRGDTTPPYTYLEVDLSTDATFMAASTYQRAISVLGPYGFNLAENAGGTISAAITSTTQTTATVSNGTLVGVGAILRVDTERMIVTERGMADTGQTSQAVLPAGAQAVTVPVPDGTQIHQGETILIDAEKMLVDTVAGNNLIVKRAWDGSALAAHNAGTAIYASRQLTLARGQLGTTAATHSANAPIAVHAAPGTIRTLAVAESMARLGSERSGYAMAISRGEMTKIGVGLPELWQQALASYQRKIRVRTAARHL
jgi:hypothetical protein